MSDVSITIGSTTKLFDLAIEQNHKLFTIKEDPVIPQRTLTSKVSYGDLPPERILDFVQKNWRGGMGQQDRFDIVDLYADGQSIDTREPNKLMLGPAINTVGAIADTILGFEFFSGREYAYSATKIYRLNAGETAWDLVFTAPGANTIACMSQYDGLVYAGLSVDKYYYSPDGTNWTQSTLDNAICNSCFLVAPPAPGGSRDILMMATLPNIMRYKATSEEGAVWVADTAYTVGQYANPTTPNTFVYECVIAGTSDSSTEPTWPTKLGDTIADGGVTWLCTGQAGWNLPTYVGDADGHITSMFVLAGTVYFGRTDGLYTVDSSGLSTPLMLEYHQRQMDSNFKYYTFWQSVFYGSLAGDILEIIGGNSSLYSIDFMGPLELNPELQLAGTVVGLASDDKNVYAVYNVGTNYIIYCGRERKDVDNGLRWEWQPWIYLGTHACGAAKVMQRAGENPKLWFAYGTNVANVLLANHPLGDTNYKFSTSGFLITTWFDANYDTWYKILYQLSTTAIALSATHQYINVYYQKDAETSWTLLTSVTTTGIQAVNLASLSCRKIRLKFELITDDTAKTPILQEYIYRGVLQPEITKTIDLTVVLGQSDSRKPSSDLTFLESGRTATAPIVLKDLRFGTTRYITFLPGTPMEIEYIDEATKQPTYRARIVAQQANWSPPV